jgi:hypothetical protein
VEPVIFPKPIAPVREADRVRRSKPREDSRDGSPFAKHLRQQQENSSGSSHSQDEEGGQAGVPAAGAIPEDAAGEVRLDGLPDGKASKKLIDIRV